MIRCRVLGSLDLRDDEKGDISSVRAQPKRLALLVYLLVADDGRFHRRDTLLGLFWPELDTTRARDNLNQAIKFLRQSLGPTAIVSRGPDEVGADLDRISCDAIAFRAEIAAGRPAQALDLYRGDLLPGFFVAEAPGFEEWLEARRAALRGEAARVARQLAEESERQHNLTLAVKWGRRAASLAADDERAFRRLLALLAKAGDRAGALQAYDDFSRRLRVDFEAEPAPETRALADEIRRDASGPAVAVASPPPGSPPPFSPLPSGSPEPAFPADGPPLGHDAPMTSGDSLAHGNYVIERPLGAGGMATVYLARDVRHGRHVAIKVLRPEVGSLAGRRALLHEIRIAASLQHPHIVPLFDSGESDGRVFYVMPYIEGESLRSRVAREGEIPMRETLRILREVASALAYAHRSGIVHRDIKPENILLAGDASTGEVHALVADFGIAKALDASQSQAGSASQGTMGALAHPLGTPGYMAPEQAAGERVDRPADVYAWGVVAYELLARRHPFAERTSPQALIAAHLGERPTPVDERRVDIPAPVARLVMQCLEKSPDARPADGTRLLAALEGGTGAERPGSRLWQRVRGGGARRVAAAAAIAVIGIAAAWVFMSARGNRARDASSASSTAMGARPDMSDASRIAVLYFDDLSPGDTLGYVANAITTYLTDELAGVQGLTVASFDAVRRLRREQISLDSMARWLSSRSLVTGSVASHHDTLAVTVRLVDGITGQQLASTEERGAMRDVFQLQRELALRISGFLRERLGQEIRLREERRGTRSVEAWNLVQQVRTLRENELWFESLVPDSLTLDHYERADSMLVKAERIDPRWAAPHIEHSILSYRRSALEEQRAWATAKRPASPNAARRATAEFWRAEALRHAEAALTASPGDRWAFRVRGEARFLFWRAATNAPDSLARLAEADLRAAAEGGAGSGAWSDLSTLYRLLGRFPEAALASERAVAADAFLGRSQDVAQELVANSLFLGRSDQAREACARARERFPRDPRVIDCDLMILGWTGDRRADADRAWRLFVEHEREDSTGRLAATRGIRYMYVAAVLARAGMHDSAEAVVRRTRAEMERRGMASTMDFWESHVHVLAGRPREAVARLTSFLAANPAYRGLVANTSWFKPLRSDSAFVRLVKGR
jgi:serine/threonine-protein kinase